MTPVSGMRGQRVTPQRSTPASSLTVGAGLGLLAAIVALGLVGGGPDWARVFLAHAWRLGTLVSGSATAPNKLAVVSVAFLTGFAVGLIGSRSFRPISVGESHRNRLLAIHLGLLYGCAIALLASYPRIAGSVDETIGGDGAVGPEYPVVLATRLLPGAACYLILMTIGVYWTARRAPQRLGAALFLAWLSFALIALGSIAWYLSPIGPAPP